MKILMIAPEPFFEPRGTPFSEYFRIKALCELGHRVDLVTYPIGEDKDIEGLKIFRCFRPPFIKAVKTGPSAAKLALDFFLFFKALARALRGGYDLIHTHEEANIMGAVLNRITKTPHLYDMHSSLVQQMENFKFTKSKMITGFFKWIEKISLRNARSVIVICRSLYDYAAGITNKEKLTVIENFMDDTPAERDREKLEQVKKEIGSQNWKIITYTGTLETYQGIPLLIDSMMHLAESPEHVQGKNGFRLVLIGGKPAQVEAMKTLVKEKGLEDRVLLLGSKKPEEIPYYLEASDVLVSPRILGTNIPLKIYSYLKSGVPVVVTNLYTHTQSINEDIAILVEPEAAAFAQGIRDAAAEKGKTVTRNAAEFCRRNYSNARYLELVTEALNKGSD